eukprot:Transcript_18588.p3 GENE.Transcript_18588~~Transcript_18588.p3  ORF type:complete len:136 (+),score=5.45 Transcript_18588:1575-1982(+)
MMREHSVAFWKPQWKSRCKKKMAMHGAVRGDVFLCVFALLQKSSCDNPDTSIPWTMLVKGPAPRAKQVVLAGEIQLPQRWTAVSDQTGTYFVDVACLALAECRLKGFKQHVLYMCKRGIDRRRTPREPRPGRLGA